MRRLTLQQMKEYAASRGGECLSETYKNKYIPLKWRCKEGHEWEATANNTWGHKIWCPKCSLLKRRSITRRHLDSATYKEHLKIQKTISCRLNGALNGHKISQAKIVKYLGCSIEELRKHLESKFKPGMTWQNRGPKGWHIDHIVPLSAFDLTKEEHISKACHYTNLQPLWWYDNLKKGGKFELGVVETLPFLLKKQSKKRRWTPEQVTALAKSKGGSCVLPSNYTYMSKIKWTCKKGHTWLSSINAVASAGHWCSKCHLENRRMPLETAIKVAASRGGKCLSSELPNSHTKLKWQCANGHIWYATANRVVHGGTWCKICFNLKKRNIYDRTLNNSEYCKYKNFATT